MHKRRLILWTNMSLHVSQSSVCFSCHAIHRLWTQHYISWVSISSFTWIMLHWQIFNLSLISCCHTLFIAKNLGSFTCCDKSLKLLHVRCSQNNNAHLPTRGCVLFTQIVALMAWTGCGPAPFGTLTLKLHHVSSNQSVALQIWSFITCNLCSADKCSPWGRF